MKRYALFLTIFLIFCVHYSPMTTAQTDKPLADYPVITAENVAQLQQVRVLGEGYINDVIFSPDEQFVAMATSVGIWLYSIDDLENPIHLFGDYAINVTYAMFSPDGSRLFGGTNTGAVYIWDFETRNIITQLSTPDETERVYELRFSNDEDMLFSYSFYHITLWNLEDFSLIKSLEVNPMNGDYSTWVISPDEQYLVIYNVYNDVNLEATFSRTYVTNLFNGDTYRIENDDISLITPPHFSHNDEKLLAFNLVGHIGMWDALSGEFLKMVNSPLSGLGYHGKSDSVFTRQLAQDFDLYPVQLPISNSFTKIILTEDESKLILLDHHSTTIFDTQNSETLHSFSYNYDVRGDYDMVIGEFQIYQSVDETALMSLIEEYNLLDLIQMRYYLSAELLERVVFWQNGDYIGSPIRLSPNKTYAFVLWKQTCTSRFISCSPHSVFTMRFWKNDTGKSFFRQDIYERCINKSYEQGAELALDNTRLVTYSNDNACVWDMENQNLLYKVPTVATGYWGIEGHNRYFLATPRLSDDENSKLDLQIWDLETDTFIETEISAVYSVSPDYGMEMAVFTHDNQYVLTMRGAYLWDLQTGTLARKLSDDEIWVSDITRAIISPNDEWVVFLTNNVTLSINMVLVKKLHDANSGYPLINYDKYTATNDVIFSPDSQYVFTITDNNLMLWDIETGDLIYEILEYTKFVAINFDGAYFVVEKDNSLIKRDTLTGDIIASEEIPLVIDPRYGPPRISHIEFSPVNNLLAVSIQDFQNSEIQIWDMDTMILLHTIPLKTSGRARFNDEGTLILMDMGDGTVHIVGVPEA